MYFLYGLPHGSENYLDRGTHSEGHPACVRSPNCMVSVAFIRYLISPCFPVRGGTARTDPHTWRLWGPLVFYWFGKVFLKGSPAPDCGLRHQDCNCRRTTLWDLLVVPTFSADSISPCFYPRIAFFLTHRKHTSFHCF